MDITYEYRELIVTAENGDKKEILLEFPSGVDIEQYLDSGGVGYRLTEIISAIWPGAKTYDFNPEGPVQPAAGRRLLKFEDFGE